MSFNNNYQQLISSLHTQPKDVVCHDCGGISTTKVQQLLSTLEGSTQLFNTTIPKKIKSKIIPQKKKISARNNSQKKNKISRKRIPNATKQRKRNIKKIRSARNNKHQIQSKQKKIK